MLKEKIQMNLISRRDGLQILGALGLIALTPKVTYASPADVSSLIDEISLLMATLLQMLLNLLSQQKWVFARRQRGCDWRKHRMFISWQSTVMDHMQQQKPLSRLPSVDVEVKDGRI